MKRAGKARAVLVAVGLLALGLVGALVWGLEALTREGEQAGGAQTVADGDPTRASEDRSEEQGSSGSGAKLSAEVARLSGADQPSLGGERSAVPLTAAETPGQRLWSARAIDARSGQGVDAAQITMSAAPSADSLGDQVSAKSSAEGHFEIRWPEQQPAYVLVEHPDYLPTRFALDWTRSEIPLVRGATLSGRVRGPGFFESETRARVVLWSELRQADGARKILTSECDSEGRFTFRGLGSGLFGVAAGGARSTVAMHAGLAAELGETLEVLLDLALGAQVSGRVLRRGTEALVEGAELNLVWLPKGLPRDVAHEFERLALTDAAGRFEVTGLTPGSVRAVVGTPWDTEHPARFDVRASGERIERDFFVGEWASCAGQVTDGLGQGIGAARVAVLSSDAEVTGLEQLLSAADSLAVLHVADSAGRFQLDQLPPQQKVVLLALPPANGSGDDGWEDSAWRPGRARSIRLAPDEEREDLVLALIPAGVLRGVALGAVDDADSVGVPLSAAEVTIEWRSSGTTFTGGQVTSDAEGRFELQAAAGRAVVRITASGYAPLERTVRIDPNLVELEQRFVLEPAGAVNWLVVDEAGHAIEGVRVRMLERNASGKRVRTKLARTDAFGQAAFEALPFGAWETAAWASGFTMVAIDPERIDLFEPGDQALEVHAELAREVSASAILRGQVIVTADDPVPVRLRFDGIGSAAVSVDAGHFEISGVKKAKSLHVTVRADGCVPHKLSVDPRAGGVLELGVIELQPATRVDVKVTAKGGKPVRGASVKLERVLAKGTPRKQRPKPLELEETSPGRYRTPHAQAGKWTIVVERKGKPKTRKSVQVRERAREVFKVVVPK